MRMLKKMLAVLTVLAMLAPVAVTAVSAEEDVTAIIDPEILESITVEEATGNGLAFLITMNVQGATTTKANEFVADNATVTVDGVTYRVTAMGAVLANTAATIRQGASALTLDKVNEERTIIDVPARYLWDYSEEDCSFAVRIIKVPEANLGTAIACRPYCVLEDGEGNVTTVYGEMDICSYNTKYYETNPEETPVWDVTVPDADDTIVVKSASAVYCPIAPVTYAEAFAVTVTLENVSLNAATSIGDHVDYICYDAEGNVLGTAKATVGVLSAGETTTAEFYVPVATATIAVSETDLDYVPVITLPAIGSDIDVVKKKDRIRVSRASAAFNEDGTIAVSLTFKNATKNWITEETDYVQYTCYDKDGTVIKTETIYIGCIDTRKNPSKTFALTVPANAAEVKITNSKITYWTEWS